MVIWPRMSLGCQVALIYSSFKDVKAAFPSFKDHSLLRFNSMKQVFTRQRHLAETTDFVRSSNFVPLMARAGLTTIVFFWIFLMGFVTSAPVPGNYPQSPKQQTHEDFPDKLLTRSLAILLDLEGRGLSDVRQPHMKRDIFPSIHDRDIDYREYFKVLKRELMAPYEYDKRNDLHKRGFFSRLRHGLGHTFSKIKKGVSKIKHVAKAIGRGIKKAGHYIKHNAAKFGKFGLKVIAAAASVAGRVAKFVPGIGTAVSLGLKGVAMGANFASNHIHARLGGVLGRISGGLNYVESPLGATTKRLGGVGRVASFLLGREY